MKYIKIILYSTLIIFIVFILSCKQERKKMYRYYEGPIQGTYFHITYEWHEDLSKEIDSLLDNFNKSLSNYDTTSLISKLNTNKTDKIDKLFERMFNKSYEIYKLTNGAFDITVAPIANLWGFGWIPKNDSIIPDTGKIKQLLEYVGMNKVKISNGKLIKENNNINFISNAIAQGLSVDYIAEYFRKLGLTNFLIEIGGELYAAGKSSRGDLWRIGVDKPIEGSDYTNRENQIILEISEKGVATSGNYRKFINSGLEKYGHSLDPRTGYPAKNSLLSATVIADDCMTADAFATAFMVMGIDKAMQIADSLEYIEAYFIFRDNQNKDRSISTSGFRKFIVE